MVNSPRLIEEHRYEPKLLKPDLTSAMISALDWTCPATDVYVGSSLRRRLGVATSSADQSAETLCVRKHFLLKLLGMVRQQCHHAIFRIIELSL